MRDSGVLAHEQGKLEEAFHLLTQAVSTANSVADRALALTSLGSLLQDLGREEEAIERYQLAIAAAPTLAAAHQNLGVLLLARNRPHEALEHFGKAQGVRPNPMNYVLAAQSLPILYQNTEEIAYWR
ncbi:MAG: tetratricopeptide repeat protein, partial [Pirellulaceae bacterium]